MEGERISAFKNASQSSTDTASFKKWNRHKEAQ